MFERTVGRALSGTWKDVFFPGQLGSSEVKGKLADEQGVDKEKPDHLAFMALKPTPKFVIFSCY